MKKLVIASMLAAAFGAAQAAQHADVVVIGAGGAGMAGLPLRRTIWAPR